jgi:hypothetical protein
LAIKAKREVPQALTPKPIKLKDNQASKAP